MPSASTKNGLAPGSNEARVVNREDKQPRTIHASGCIFTVHKLKQQGAGVCLVQGTALTQDDMKGARESMALATAVLRTGGTTDWDTPGT